MEREDAALDGDGEGRRFDGVAEREEEEDEDDGEVAFGQLQIALDVSPTETGDDSTSGGDEIVMTTASAEQQQQPETITTRTMKRKASRITVMNSSGLETFVVEKRSKLEEQEECDGDVIASGATPIKVLRLESSNEDVREDVTLMTSIKSTVAAAAAASSPEETIATIASLIANGAVMAGVTSATVICSESV
jgi:hypothetical protein